MVGAEEAREKAAVAASEHDDVVLGSARELESGWYFPMVGKRPVWTGVIVDKRTGESLVLMVDCSLDRDPTLYDLGYRFSRYDLVVHDVHDLDATIRVLRAIRCTTWDPYYSGGKVHRDGRQLTDDQLRARLEKLPAIFPCAMLYDLDDLEEARKERWFRFELLEGGTW